MSEVDVTAEAINTEGQGAVEAAAESALRISISASAAQEIVRQRDKRGKPGAAIRIGIRGGGCTGFAYLFEWDDAPPKEHDHVFEKDGAVVYVDPKSMVYFQGTELDFVRGMMGHGFKFNNPNVTGSCGCGESVQF